MDARPDDLVFLVVDDDASIRQVLEECLEAEFGARVLTAEHGQRALEVLSSETPALILTDVRMPVLNGVQFVQQLRSDPSTREIPVIVVAATPARRDEAMAAGGDDYLDKPFDIDALSAKVRRNLGSHGGRRGSGGGPRRRVAGRSFQTDHGSAADGDGRIAPRSARPAPGYLSLAAGWARRLSDWASA